MPVSALPAGTLWRSWEFHPAVVLPLAVVAGLYARGVHALWRQAGTGHGIRRWQATAFAAGWAVLALALVSPLHELGEVLFSAHMVQHELLMAVAAPLLVLGRPVVPFLWGLPIGWRRWAGRAASLAPIRGAWAFLTLPPVAWLLHALAIWVWHVPRFYDASLSSDTVHALQHASFLGGALLFWWALIHGRRARLGYGASVLYLFTTALHTTALGAVLALAPRPLYPAYAAVPGWGLSALEDQQVAGLIMWVPAGVAYLVAALALMAGWLRESERRVVRAETAALPAGGGA